MALRESCNAVRPALVHLLLLQNGNIAGWTKPLAFGLQPHAETVGSDHLQRIAFAPLTPFCSICSYGALYPAYRARCSHEPE
jgi:hypothetical protein